MAKKPDGAAAGTQRVTFTKPAAERIGKVVRTVEAGNRDQGPLTFGPRVGGVSGTPIRLAYYTATDHWLVALPGAETTTSNSRTIQFAFPTGQTAATAVCVNNMGFLPRLSSDPQEAKRVILVFKEAGQWRLMGARS